jgi:hypothetical protein
VAALATRETLLQARDPLRLLFVDLPAALNFPPVTSGGPHTEASIDVFVENLGLALTEIAGAYPKLVELIQRHLSEALELPRDLGALRGELSERAQRIREWAQDPTLRAFVARANDDTMLRETWLDSLATFLGGRPPTHWTDVDLNRFETALAEIGRLFLRAEDLAIEGKDSMRGESGVVELLRVTVASAREGERRRLVRVREVDEKEATHAEAVVKNLIASLCPERADLQFAVLSRILQDLMQSNDRQPLAATPATKGT